MACLPIPYRYYLSIMAGIAVLLLTGMRAVFILVATHTVKHAENVTETGPLTSCRTENTSLDFQSDFQAEMTLMFHLAYYVGVILGLISGSILINRFPANKFVGVTMALTSILHLIIPRVYLTGFAGFVCVVRFASGVLEGLVLPAAVFIICSWSFPGEKSRMLALIAMGSTLGFALGSIVAGETICHVSWDSGLYIYSGAGGLWSMVWLMTSYSVPRDCPHLSEEEQMLHISHKENVMSGCKQVALAVPYRKIFLSMPVWCIWLSRFTGSWSIATLTVVLPQYFKFHFDFNVSELGWLCSFQWVLKFFVLFSFAFIADKLISSKWLSVTNTRKLMQLSGSILESVFIILGILFQAWVPAYVSFVLSSTAAGITENGYRANQADLSLQYSNVVSGIAMTGSIGAAVSMLFTAVVQLAQSTDDTSWTFIFLCNGALAVISSLVFVFLASGERQAWDGNVYEHVIPADGSESDGDTDNNVSSHPSSDYDERTSLISGK